ncbi:hypothetical protein FE68_15760, partial [Staphylococcus aureus]
VALDLAAAGGVEEHLRRLGDDGGAGGGEPVDQGADRREFLSLEERGGGERAQQGPAALKFLQKALVIDIEAQSFRRRVEIGPVDEERDLVGRRR